jgi:hypothetical protein
MDMKYKRRRIASGAFCWLVFNRQAKPGAT